MLPFEAEMGEFSTLKVPVNTGTVPVAPPLVVVTFVCAPALAARSNMQHLIPLVIIRIAFYPFLMVHRSSFARSSEQAQA